MIPPQFDWASGFSEGLAAVLVNNKYGFIDETGAVVIEPRYTDFGGFSGGLARVKVGGATISRRAGTYAREIKNENWRYIDRFDNAIISIRAHRADDFSEGLASVTISMSGGEETACGYIDRQGLWAIEPRFLRCEPFSNGVAQVRLNGEQRQIDKQGYFIAERK